MPDLVGQPIIHGDADIHAVRAPEVGPADGPWPEFIRQVLLSPTDGNPDLLELPVETVADTPGGPR
ncbi:MAG: hypothetical protein IH623_00850 [Verrucomicrobia bacterium]|nr:hypothetical protein [Verrucomicrobiota bacterium]